MIKQIKVVPSPDNLGDWIITCNGRRFIGRNNCWSNLNNPLKEVNRPRTLALNAIMKVWYKKKKKNLYQTLYYQKSWLFIYQTTCAVLLQECI